VAVAALAQAVVAATVFFTFITKEKNVNNNL
jgi:hypothetical protein